MKVVETVLNVTGETGKIRYRWGKNSLVGIFAKIVALCIWLGTVKDKKPFASVEKELIATSV